MARPLLSNWIRPAMAKEPTMAAVVSAGLGIMVMTTATVQGLKIDLPKPSNKPSTDHKEIRIIQIQPDGSLLMVERRVQSLRSPDGELFFLWTVLDRSAQHESEEKLERLLSETAALAPRAQRRG